MDLLIKIFAIIGVIALFLIILIIGISFFISRGKIKVPQNTVLEIDFEKGLIETSPETMLGSFFSKDIIKFKDIVLSLETASKDKRIKGIVAHIGSRAFSYGEVEEIRDAVINFRKSGKPAYVYAETFGDLTTANSSYYLATAFDSISLQPTGDLGLTGILSETPFLKNLMGKIGVKPQIDSRKEYKTARNMFTESSYTPEHKEMNLSIINSIKNQLINSISNDRRLNKDSLRQLIAEGPFTAQNAFQQKLVDKLEYRDQVYDRIRSKFGKNLSFLYLQRYAQTVRSRGKKTIALIYGDGTITQGKSKSNPYSNSASMGAQTVAEAFRAAVKDKNVAAIVFRINSPGGSYIGSDVIWRETILARKAGKPVIVTMGSVAGSGGYYVAMNADKIIAHPSTLTGSIGVVGGKIVSKGLFNKIGITFDHVETDSNATMWSPTIEYSEKQWLYIQMWLDTIYDDFVSKVATGRKLTKEQVQALAKGRVYTGIEAQKIGLVDTLGGYKEAFSVAKDLIGVAGDTPVRIKVFPIRKSFWEKFFRGRPKSSEDLELPELLLQEQLENSKIPDIFSPLAEAFDQRNVLLMEHVNLQ